ncbi:metallophosphoesterase family protein [Paenibacillus solanacearum]|nr:metallophosphoesterase [Paenibacillus solanacearum]
MEDVPQPSPDRTVIRIAGIDKEIRMLHITDSHLTETDEREEDSVTAAGIKRNKVFGGQALTHFTAALNLHEDEPYDGIVFTGDIIDFPTRKNLEIVQSQLSNLPCPYLFTMGNHDWKHDHEQPSDELRHAAYPMFNHMLGLNPSHSSMEIGGVKIIAIDNSNYQVSRKQLDFVQEQTASGLPCLLFFHIPLSLPSLTSKVLEVWKSPILVGAKNWDKEKQKRWGVKDEEAGTREFIEWIKSPDASQVAGIFCGHVHFAHREEFAAGRYQYVTNPGFQGGCRTIVIQPL